MNYNNEDNEMWDWQSQDYYCLEENTSIEISECLLNGANQNEDHISYMFDDETTPAKACGDHVTNNVIRGKELEQYGENSSQAKRRRMLQFEPEVLDAPLCDEAFLRSQETEDSLDDGLSEMSQWVAGFTEDTAPTINECLDPSSEGWIANCFNDDMHLCTEDFSSVSEASDIQIDVTELCDDAPPQYDANPVKKHPVHTRRNVVFKGRKSYMRSPPKLSSSIVYPFAFIKPCGAHGDTTLQDINQRIHNPPKPKPIVEEDPCASYPMSAFSGKPVVGKTKIRTEGGKGSITIMRTKG